MNRPSVHRLSRVAAACAAVVCAAVVCVVVAASGCSLPLPPPSPLQPAPPFHYLPRDTLQSAMWTLADNVTTLDHLLDDGAAPQADVVAALDGMQHAVSTLGAPGTATNHPLLDRELPRFALDIAAARRDAAATPPSYLLARSLSSACLRCHGGR